MKRFIFAMTVLLTICLADFRRVETATANPSPNDLIVHEWGTFTSIAGQDGTAVDWRPLNGASDLPKFVYTLDDLDGFRGSYKSGGKGVAVKVRMETPVIYFYTAKEMEVFVNVNFPNGRITEWFPQASIVNRNFAPNRSGNYLTTRFNSGINWGTIKLLPNEQPQFLREAADSHYYPARETDAVAVQVCNTDKTKIETEKFLFYRGIGNFGLPLAVTIDGKNLTLTDNGTDEIKNIIVFENRGGRIGFKVIKNLSKKMIVSRPETDKTQAEIFVELEKILTAEGLYPKEAKAMIETWKDSWFEEGLRVFYVLTRNSIDKILPLQVAPTPKETIRVFVGRTEIITPEMEQDVKREVALLRSTSAKVRRQARANLQKHGRFYEPILKNIRQKETNEKVREQIERLIAAN